MVALTAKNLLSQYAGQGNDFYQRLSLVIERYLKAMNPRGSKQTTAFTIYTDVDGQAVITLPRSLNTILAGNLISKISNLCSIKPPLKVENSWHQSLSSGPGIEPNLLVDSFISLEDRVTVFRDWTTAMQLRFKFEQSETAGKIIVRGSLAGTNIYSTDGGNWIEGIAVAYTGSATVTTTQQFDFPPYAIIKPITKGRVSMYTWDGTTETLVAIYDPTETFPAYRRYRVPSCSNPADNPTFIAICKKEWQPITGDNDVLLISNLGALQAGLEAKQAEDAKDRVRAKQLWADGKEMLSNESEDDIGAGAEGRILFEDVFEMASVGCGQFGYGGLI